MKPLEPLTPRETEVLALYLSGYRNCEIVEELGMSKRTVDVHLRHCRDKYGFADNHKMAIWLSRAA